ncbi:MAG: PilZ domain-containing protein [Phycisphaerales bacterium JB043]
MNTQQIGEHIHTWGRWLKDGVRETIAQFRPGYEYRVEEQKEKRRHPRKTCATMVYVTPVSESGSPTHPIDAAVLDVSKKGLRVVLEERVNKGVSVMVDLGRSKGAGRTILARVAHVHRASGQPGFVLGLRTEQ